MTTPLPASGARDAELRATLRVRLLVSAALFVGFYGVLGLINIPLVRSPASAPGAVRLMIAQWGVSVAITLLALVIWRVRDLSLRTLRIAELAMFALGAGFLAVANLFTVQTHHLLALPEGRVGHPFFTASGIRLDAMTLRWFAVMTGYGLVIPNTWRRCATVTGLMAFTYLGSIVGQAAIGGAGASTITYLLVYPTLWMIIAWVAAGFGAYRVGVLEQQVADARKLGQYRLTRRIGSGGMGEVWMAEHVLLQQTRAVKVVRPEAAVLPETLQRFEREVKATARMKHRNTVEIYDYGRAADGTFYYVMEYLAGYNLEELVQRYGVLSPARTIHLLRQVCSVLRAAHGQGLIHRDIKPANVFVCECDGVPDTVKLLDFGLVKHVGGDAPDARLTVEGAITGTPAFMSPEQIGGGGPVDARSDIYGLGCLAYLLLTGRPPFGDRPLVAAIAAHLHEAPEPIARTQSDVSAELDGIVLKCLAKKPSDRFVDVAVLDAALAQCPEAGAWTERDASGWWRRHGRRSGETSAIVS